MKTEQEIKRQLTELVKAARQFGPPVTIEDNAPVALSQLETEAEIKALKWVLAGKEKKDEESAI